MAGIFVSYRRLDSGDVAGRLFDHLARHFGKAQVFMDINGGIERGADFEFTLRQALDRCDVLLALIGSHWATCTDEQGQCRLERGDDWVRNEIATAIRRGIPLFPVVFGDARFPPSDIRLPDDISRLVKHQLSRIRNESWGYDTGELISTIEKYVRSMPNAQAAASPSSGVQQSVTGDQNIVVGTGAITVNFGPSKG